MAGEKDDRLRQDSQQREAREVRGTNYARIKGALELGGAILDRRLDKPELVLPIIIEYLTPLADTGRQVSDYDTKSIGQALLVKAIGGKVEMVQVEQLNIIDGNLNVMEANPFVQSALRKYDEYELLGQGEEQPDLSYDELNEFAKYNTELGNKAWLLDNMTDGVAGMVAERDAATTRARRLGVQKEILESKGLGDLSPEELARYNGYLDKMFAKLPPNEIRDYERLSSVPLGQLSRVDVAVLNGMLTEMMTGLDPKDHEDSDYVSLKDRASRLSDREKTLLGLVDAKVASLKNRANELQDLIEAKAKTLGANNEWMKLYNAYNGMVDNMNVTAQWRIAWHDLSAGAVDNFTQTRWAEYQKTSDLVALMELPGVGEAMQKAFRAITRLALNKGIAVGDVEYRRNIYQEKDLKAQDTDEFFSKVKQYVQAGNDGVKQDMYAEFGVEMARMLFENSLAAGWCAVERNDLGEIIYGTPSIVNSKTVGVAPFSGDTNSIQYMSGVPSVLGDGSGYADRTNDYIKVAETRIKLMNEAVNSYPTGLPAMLPVLPDWVRDPWISHKDLTAIADGKIDLNGVFSSKSESSRWSWSYSLFRAAQVYDSVSRFIVGLKGFRGIGDEVEFFLKSPSNLGDIKKKIEVALGKDSTESQRFCMNMVMSLLYSVNVRMAPADNSEEIKTVVPSDKEGQGETWVNFKKDDYQRVFVRTGFISKEAFNLIWDRLNHYFFPGAGGRANLGMIKKGERLSVYQSGNTREAARLERRKRYVSGV